jgi:hypothetical protein
MDMVYDVALQQITTTYTITPAPELKYNVRRERSITPAPELKYRVLRERAITPSPELVYSVLREHVITPAPELIYRVQKTHAALTYGLIYNVTTDTGTSTHTVSPALTYAVLSEHNEGATMGTFVSDGQPRFDSNGLAIEEATANLQAANLTDGRITTMSPGGTTPPTATLVSSDNPFAGDGKAWQIVFPGTVNIGYAGCRAIGGNWTCVAGTTYTTTAWVKCNDMTGITMYHTGMAGMSSLTATGRTNGEWAEYRSTSAPGLSGTDYLTVYASSTSAASKTILIGASMVEQKAYGTSYTGNSRSNEMLSVPMDGFNEESFTVEAIITPHQSGDGKYLLSINAGPDKRFDFKYNADGKLVWEYHKAGGV